MYLAYFNFSDYKKDKRISTYSLFVKIFFPDLLATDKEGNLLKVLMGNIFIHRPNLPHC